MMIRRCFLGVALVAVAAASLHAQTHVDTVLLRAHTQLVAQEYELALQLLNDSVLATGIERTPQQTAWAQVLRGLAFLQSDPPLRERAQQAFLVYLRTDSTVRADTVLYLDYAGGAVARTTIAAAHTQLPPPPPPPPTVQLVHAADTSIAVDGAYWILARTTRVAGLAVWITDTAGTVLWRDSLRGAADSTVWTPRTSAGQLLPPGAYTLQAVARSVTDSLIPQPSRTLLLSRVPVDTQMTPAPPVMLPEQQDLRHGSPGIIIGGLAFGAAAVLLPTAMGHPDLNTGQSIDNTSYVAAGAVVVASIVGWATSSRTRYLLENHQTNQYRQRQYEATTSRIAEDNRQRVAAARVRIQVDGGGQ